MNIKSILALIFLFSSSVVYCQSNVSVLLNGKFTDLSGKPVSCSFKFKNQDGNIIPGKTNIIDGTYQVILYSNTKYNVQIQDYLINDNNYAYEVPDYKEYTELTKDFIVNKIETGMKISISNGFVVNSDKLSDNGKEALNKLKVFLDINPKVIAEIIINSSDCNFKPENKKKKAKSNDNISALNASSILGKRMDSVREYLNSLNVRDIRAEISGENIPYANNTIDNKTSKKKKNKKIKGAAMPKTDITTLKINVKKIMNL